MAAVAAGERTVVEADVRRQGPLGGGVRADAETDRIGYPGLFHVAAEQVRPGHDPVPRDHEDQECDEKATGQD